MLGQALYIGAVDEARMQLVIALVTLGRCGAVADDVHRSLVHVGAVAAAEQLDRGAGLPAALRQTAVLLRRRCWYMARTAAQ
jgi:hypothetical protein